MTMTLYMLVRWIHDYQDACVDKLENFITGGDESSARLLSSTTRPDMSKASSITSPPPELHGPVFPPPTVGDSAPYAASSNTATTDSKDVGGSKPRDSTSTKGTATVRPPASSENSVKSAPNKPQCSAT